MSEFPLQPGLADVPVAKSQISSIDGDKGILRYRGIPIEELADKSNFVESTYLLVFGHLPSSSELEQFSYDLTHHRRLKYNIIDLIKDLPDNGHPMDATQGITAVMGMFYPSKDFADKDVQYQAILRLIAKLPTLIAAVHRMRFGDLAVLPNDELDHASNFLYMLSEEEPEADKAKILDTALILHMEHTMNASTFSARVTASTLADPFTVISSAIGTLTGPLHGGANERVLDMLKDIGTVDNVRPYLEKRLENKQKIMGFGHREYKVKDPRAKILQRLAVNLFDKYGSNPLYEVALKTEEVMNELVGSRGIYPNVDFYSGLVYDKLGISADLYTPIFAMARVVGWLAHWVEQISDNKIFRPDVIYTGEKDSHYVDIGRRS